MMKNKPILSLVVALAALQTLHAERNLGLGVDAYASLKPVVDGVLQKGAPAIAFSPFSFELACCSFAEAFDSIGRADIAENMGVLTDFDSAYRPLVEKFLSPEANAATNGFSMLAARALCLPDVFQANVEYRKRINEMNGTAVCLDHPPTGAESWFKAMMDAQMEDFAYPVSLRHDPSLYRFIDAVVVRATVGVGTGAQLKAVGFAPEDAKISVVPFLRFPATVSYCRNERGFTVRVPLAENTFLYILTPLKGKSLASLEASVKGENIREIIAGVESVTEKDCGSVDGVVELPAMDFTSIVDTDAAFTVAKIPTSGFVHIDSSLAKRESFQYTRFILEGAPAEPAEDGKSAKKRQANDKGQRRFVFNRPFLFFIYNREADLIPVIGRFTGK